jgi:hypothetical protein
MFGQLIFPRLVARNSGDGRASIFVRPLPDLIRGAHWAALWEGGRQSDAGEFWSCYKQLLGLVARARDKAGLPNFEPHKITRLYEEIIQATNGSRWVWALTFASSIEALARMLYPTPPKLAALLKHIKSGPGEDDLKQVAIEAARRAGSITAKRALIELRGEGVISKEQLSAWDRIRNAVMHGSLVGPYSSEEEDAQLLALAAMMHALTREFLRRSS